MSSEMTNNNENVVENVMTTSATGVSYQVLLEPAKPNAIASPRIAQSPTAKLSLEDIQIKLKLAEERRASVEAEKIEKATKVEIKLAEVTQRRDAKVEQFRKASEQELQKKMENSQEYRDRLMNERKEKMKEHEKHVEEVRKAKENMVSSPTRTVAAE